MSKRVVQSNRSWPDFFLVGVPKGGTTSTYNYLSQHPGIFVPSIKEPHFFACPEVKETYYQVDFIEKESDYLNLYAKAESKVKGDFSPSYLFNDYAAQRIQSKCPEAKIIMILRHPIDRAISHYLMDVQAGYNSLSLQESISNSNSFFFKEYIEVGLYHHQVTKYFTAFPKEQILILFFDDLKRNPASFLIQILDFLGLDTTFHFDLEKQHLKFQQYKSSSLKKLVHSNLYQQIQSLIPETLKAGLKSIFINEKKPAFESEKKQLFDYFETDLQKLNTLLHSPIIDSWLSH